MADKSLEHDKKVLHSMGYAQQLARRMSGFSNFAISFSIICILAGGISSFPAVFNSAGAGGVIWVYLHLLPVHYSIQRTYKRNC